MYREGAGGGTEAWFLAFHLYYFYFLLFIYLLVYLFIYLLYLLFRFGLLVLVFLFVFVRFLFQNRVVMVDSDIPGIRGKLAVLAETMEEDAPPPKVNQIC